MKKKEGFLGSLLAALPVIIFAAVSILTVRLHYCYRPMTQFGAIGLFDVTQLTDFFAYYKMVVLVAGGILAAVAMLISGVFGLEKRAPEEGLKARLKAKDPWAMAAACAAVYLLLVLLSFLFSEYKIFAWLGWPERFEGTLAIMAYIAVLFYLMRFVRDPRAVKIMLVGLGIGVLGTCVVGYFQGSGQDLFRTVWGQKLIVPNLPLADGRTAWEAIDQLNAEGRMIYSIEFEEGEVYSTLYNINYVPFYLCTVLPVIALCFVGLFDKELKLGKTARIVIGAVLIALYGLGLYNFFCANSASGYAGLAVMFLLALIVFRKQLKAWAKPVLCVLLVSAAVIGGLFPRWYPELRKTVKDADFLTSSLFTPVYALTPDDFKNKPASKHCTIDYIVTGADYVLFSIYGNELYMNYIGGAVSFTDAEDNGIPVYLYNEKTNAYTFLDERFHDYITFRFDNETGVHTLHTRNRDWDFLFTEHTAIYKALSGKWITLHKVDKFGFEGHYKFGSGRGYIWSRSLPLLKDTILIGHGADTFCAYFPNDDYAGKFSTIGWPDWALNTIYDKPHDLYIQTGVNTGVLSLIAQLGIFFFYFRDSLKTGFGLRKKEDQNVSNGEGASSAVSALGILPYAAMGCFLGVAGYLTVGIFNDSSVSTAPYFYSVLGLGFCINAMIRESEKSGQTEPGAKAA